MARASHSTPRSLYHAATNAVQHELERSTARHQRNYQRLMLPALSLVPRCTYCLRAQVPWAHRNQAGTTSMQVMAGAMEQHLARPVTTVHVFFGGNKNAGCCLPGTGFASRVGFAHCLRASAPPCRLAVPSAPAGRRRLVTLPHVTGGAISPLHTAREHLSCGQHYRKRATMPAGAAPAYKAKAYRPRPCLCLHFSLCTSASHRARARK